jgi:hypothetical protein
MADFGAMTFEEWLAKRGEEDSPVGDLANDVARDKTWPTGAGIEVYRGHVAHGSSAAVEALNSAWKRYRAYLSRIERKRNQTI